MKVWNNRKNVKLNILKSFQRQLSGIILENELFWENKFIEILSDVHLDFIQIQKLRIKLIRIEFEFENLFKDK